MRNFCTAAVLAATFSLLVPHTLAQAPAGGGAPRSASSHGAHAQRYGFAVVDISYLFKRYEKFSGQMEGLKAKYETTDAEMRRLRQEIAQMEEALPSQFQPGSREYRERDEEIEKRKVEFNLDVNRHRKDILEAEAKIYHQTYLEVVDAVKYVAQRQNLGMVLRFSGDPINPNKPEDVMRAINRPIVYQNSIDITPDVLSVLQRDSGGPQTANRGQVPGRPTR